MNPSPSEIAFLGICDRLATINKHPLEPLKYNILGLRRIVSYPVLPINIQGSNLLFAVYNIPTFQSAFIEMCDSNGVSIFNTHIEFVNKATLNDKAVNKTASAASATPKDESNPTANISIETIVFSEGNQWSILNVQLVVPVLIQNTGIYKFFMRRGEDRTDIGSLSIRYLKVPPLSEEVKAALRSNPNAAKKTTYIIRCPKCKDTFSIYAALDKNVEEEEKGNKWYQDIPDDFKCQCGYTNFPLVKIRENLHALLGVITTIGTDVQVSKLYESEAIENISFNFFNLINQNPDEQRLQTFFQNSLILLHQFTPEKIFPKAPILTKYKTDFIIKTQSGELILIELEKAGTQLLKKDGGRHSELQHAADQVRDWVHTLETHKTACLDCIGLKVEEITRIRGVVIAGRDSEYDPVHLNRLKWDLGRDLVLYTYDDIMRSLVGLYRTVHQL